MTLVFSPIINDDGRCLEPSEVRVRNQNGALYPRNPLSGIITIPDYGDHPDTSITSAPGAGASPITIDEATPNAYAVEWGGQWVGATLYGADGVTPLFAGSSGIQLSINGATATTTIIMGIRVQPSSADLGRRPTISLAFAPTPPTTWSIDNNNEAAGNQGPTSARPAHRVGLSYFDETLGRPIWSNGTIWRSVNETTGLWETV